MSRPIMQLVEKLQAARPAPRDDQWVVAVRLYKDDAPTQLYGFSAYEDAESFVLDIKLAGDACTACEPPRTFRIARDIVVDMMARGYGADESIAHAALALGGGARDFTFWIKKNLPTGKAKP